MKHGKKAVVKAFIESKVFSLVNKKVKTELLNLVDSLQSTKAQERIISLIYLVIRLVVVNVRAVLAIGLILFSWPVRVSNQREIYKTRKNFGSRFVRSSKYISLSVLIDLVVI